MLKINPNTGIRIQSCNGDYIPGKGVTPVWVDFKFTIGNETFQTFPVEWTNAFGSDVISAQSLNIKELATIRMGFNPKLCELLNSQKVRIFRNNETDEKMAFEVYGSCDNVKMLNQQLEFKVKRLEGK